MTSDNELTELLVGLASRVRSHPPSTWSPRLLALVSAAVDLEFGAPHADAEPARRLQVVR